MKKLQLTDMELSDLFRQLNLLVNSGAGAGDGLSLLAGESEPPYRELLESLAEEVDMGGSLSAALKHSGSFPGYAAGLVAVGEETGRLDEALGALGDYYEQQDLLSRQIRSALLYPCVLLVLMLTVIAVLLTRVLPVFRSVYTSLGGDLTGVAGGLYRVGLWLNGVLPLLSVGVAALVGLLLAFSCSPRFRGWCGSQWNRRRGDRGLARRISDARVAQVMAMGLRSGLPLESTLELAAGLLEEGSPARQRCDACIRALEEGEPLERALGVSGVLPPSGCRMLALAQRSGKVDEAMENQARRLTDQARQGLEDLLARVEPTLVLICSVLVGLILLSVMLPLMDIMTAIG